MCVGLMYNECSCNYCINRKFDDVFWFQIINLSFTTKNQATFILKVAWFLVVNVCLHFTILKFVYVFIAPHCGQIPLCLRPVPHLPQV